MIDCDSIELVRIFNSDFVEFIRILQDCALVPQLRRQLNRPLDLRQLAPHAVPEKLPDLQKLMDSNFREMMTQSFQTFLNRNVQNFAPTIRYKMFRKKIENLENFAGIFSFFFLFDEQFFGSVNRNRQSYSKQVSKNLRKHKKFAKNSEKFYDFIIENE